MPAYVVYQLAFTYLCYKNKPQISVDYSNYVSGLISIPCQCKSAVTPPQSMALYHAFYSFWDPGGRNSSYLGNDGHITILNASAYVVYKSLLHTIHSLVKKSQSAKAPSVGGVFLPQGVHAGVMTREGEV